MIVLLIVYIDNGQKMERYRALTLRKHIIFVSAMRSHERLRDVCRVCRDILLDGMKQGLFNSAADRSSYIANWSNGVTTARRYSDTVVHVLSQQAWID